MGAFGTLLTITVAGAIFCMLYRISGRFWAAGALSIPVYAAFLFNIAPPPLFFSVILFTITLSILIDWLHEKVDCIPKQILRRSRDRSR